MNWLYDFLSENFVHALGWTVLHSLWQGLIIGLVLSLILMNAPTKSAENRCRLSFVALLLMLVSSVVTFVFMWKKTNTTAENSDLEAFILRGPISVNRFFDTPTFFEKLTLFFNENAPIIALMWLLGVVFFSIRLIGGLLFIQELRTRQLFYLESDWQNRVNIFKNKLKISRAVGIAESALIAVPMTLGWLKPLILLPIGTINKMTTGEVEAILAHELAHIAGRDYLLNILQSVIEIIFYFNPAVWWIAANIRAERENRCDDIAVSLSNSVLTYAKALLSIQEMQQPDARLFGLTLTFADNRRKGFLLKRIKRILNQPHNRSHIMEKLTATGLLLAVVTALSFSGNKFLNSNSLTEQQNSLLENSGSDPSVSAANSLIFNAFDATSDWVPTISDIMGSADSLPKRSGTISIQTDDYDGKAVKLATKDGKITELEVDGKVIPQADFGKYQNLTDDILANLPAPPPPPPTPFANGWNVPSPPTPPSPPSNGWNMPPMPPMPPVPPMYLKKSKDAQGNTIIKMKKRDGQTSEIKITADKEVFVDGKKIKEGDDTYLEFGDTDGSDFQIVMPDLDVQLFGNGTPIIEKSKGDSAYRIRVNPEIKNRIWFNGDSTHSFYFNNGNFNGFYDAEKWRQNADLMRRNAKEVAEMYRLNADKMRLNTDELRRNTDKLRRDAKRLRDSYSFHYNSDEGDRDGMNQKEALENELAKDGFLTGDKKKYKIELTDKKLKINAKTMSDEMHQRYRRLLGQSSSGSFKITIEENSN